MEDTVLLEILFLYFFVNSDPNLSPTQILITV